MKIGVFLCEGNDIKNVVDLDYLKNSVSQEENIVSVTVLKETLCSVDGQNEILKGIKENEIDHLVVAACSPKLYEEKFRKVLENTNVNPANFVIANIREHASYAHSNDSKLATKKAELYLKLAIEQVRHVHPLDMEKSQVTKHALVVGGGWSGLRAALGIAMKGFYVDVLEKSDKLGGDLINFNRLPPKDTGSYGEINSLVSEILSNDKINVRYNSVIKKIKGWEGNYLVTFSENGQDNQLRTGAVVVAIGHKEYNAKEFDKQNNPDVVSLKEYNDMLKPTGSTGGKILKPSSGEPPNSIAFVKCNGSLDPKKNNYCSKYCCEMTASAVRQTKKQISVPINVYYKDVRAFNNVSETYINDTMALEGVTYQKGVPENIDSDLIVLANAVEPAVDTDNVRKALVLDKDKSGFFREADFLMNRVATYEPGKFVIGTCSGPKTITERIEDARVASDLVTNLLAKNEIIKELFVSETNENLCGGCGTCIRTCAFGAISNEPRDGSNRGVAVIDKALCRGCGNCVSACPQSARDLVLYPNLLMQKSVDLLSLFRINQPKILIYACNGCAYPALDQAARVGYELPPNLFILRAPCSGRVDTQFIEYALTKGFDGVMIGMCETNSCHYLVGNEDVCKRIDLLNPLLESKGISKERIGITPVCFSRGEDAVKAVNDFIEKIKNLMEGEK
ncbi:MAG: hydrogenase iron-sulfur subunit [Nanoarchaeota archaeon]